MRRRKGQAALEFLTTYGWAFLVIIVMIGALAYFGVLSPKRFVTERCFMGTEFLCDKDTSSAISGDAQIKIQIVNKASKSIDIAATPGTYTTQDDVACTGASTWEGPDPLPNNGRGNLTFETCAGSQWTPGEKLNIDFSLNYAVDSFQKAAPGNLVITVT